MKIGAKDSRKGLFYITLIATALSGAALYSGCAKAPDGASNSQAGGDGQLIQVRGYAAFGSQCSSGFNTDPHAVKLELMSCPVNLQVMELNKPIQPLYLSADCRRKTLTIRSYDRTIDSSWELLPDGTFSVTQDGLTTELKSDGAGNTNCTSPISLDLWGQVDCSAGNTDQAKIRFEAVMRMNAKPTASQPTNLPSPGPSGRPALPTPPPVDTTTHQCKLPDGCFLHTISSVTQCS